MSGATGSSSRRRPGAPDAWLMGIDIGAGSLKTMVVGSDGRVGGSASADLVTASPQPRFSEQDPAHWWRALCDTVPRALAQAGIGADAVAGVSFSAGAHTPVLEDAQGRVLRPAILWSDQRSGDQVRRLRERAGDRILALAYNAPSPTWTLPQLWWLCEHEPEVARAARRLYVAKDWLRTRLTGTWETDRTDAVGTMLMDVGADRWSEELCALAGWDPATLPPLVQPTDVVGTVTPAAAAQCGLRAGTPVVCGTSDTSIETFGAGSIHPGDGTVKLATAATFSVVSAQPNVHATLINYPLVVPGRWYTITGTNSCASAHRWLRDRFFLAPGGDGAAAFAEMDRLAAETPAGSEGLLFHPYLQGERAPHWDPLLRADYVGLTFAHGRGHLVRALYEGIAFSLRDILEQFRARQLVPGSARIVGGGARSATWRQIIADVLDLPITQPLVTDASFGAALVAGIGTGVFADAQAAVAACVREGPAVLPRAAFRPLHEELFGLYREAAQGLRPVYHALSRLPAGPP